MDALHAELPIAAQIGVLLAILVGTLIGERLSKCTYWGFVLSAAVSCVALYFLIFQELLYFAGRSRCCSGLTEAYVRHRG